MVTVLMYIKSNHKNKIPGYIVPDRLLFEWSPRELWQLETENLGDWGPFFMQEHFFARMLQKVCQSHDQNLYYRNSKFETKC